MRPRRLQATLDYFRTHSDADVVGGVFDRIPAGSTPRYEAYHRRLSMKDMFTYAFRDAPLPMPTVACRRVVWECVRFQEGVGIPEDLHFLYGAMEHGFSLHKMGGESVTGYMFHDAMTSLSLHRRTLLSVRVQAFERLVLTLEKWKHGFSIWGCGRDGKEAYKRLSDSGKRSVWMWGDVNVKKIGKKIYGHPVVHFSEIRAPVVCCVAMDRFDGEFEQNLRSLNLRPGEDYVHLI